MSLRWVLMIFNSMAFAGIENLENDSIVHMEDILLRGIRQLKVFNFLLLL